MARFPLLPAENPTTYLYPHLAENHAMGTWLDSRGKAKRKQRGAYLVIIALTDINIP
jgi:hypothetical protein